ncbi:uncharacterized protein LOC129613587 [Condylostylus longicornis]|uniref:uncharacterized protein LOC129613587 n=1 Tax=Condylostylus longicornis TaxID=2530218 RepID=UPI00244E308D|nr:uncharacterized protein LOC129613587 [Condylostylus longicornis]
MDFLFEEPHEMQHAECTVTAGEVKASAEAKTTKTLKGVCGSDEMRRSFENLELKIERRFEELKNLLNSSGVISEFNNFTTKSSNIKNKNLSDQQVSSRYAEIERLNKTLISDEELKIFSYYWKIENFTQKLNNKNYPTETSPLFSIFGNSNERFGFTRTNKYG